MLNLSEFKNYLSGCDDITSYATSKYTTLKGMPILSVHTDCRIPGRYMIIIGTVRGSDGVVDYVYRTERIPGGSLISGKFLWDHFIHHLPELRLNDVDFKIVDGDRFRFITYDYVVDRDRCTGYGIRRTEDAFFNGKILVRIEYQYSPSVKPGKLEHIDGVVNFTGHFTQTPQNGYFRPVNSIDPHIRPPSNRLTSDDIAYEISSQN